MTYYLECTDCERIFTNDRQCDCTFCGSPTVVRITTGLKPALPVVRFAPEFSSPSGFDLSSARALDPRPARFLVASLLLAIVVGTIGMLGGKGNAMEACQQKHSFDVCFSSLNR